MDIDELPVGKGGPGMAEMPDEDDVECFDSIPLATLLASSNWKERRAGLDRIAASPNDASLRAEFFAGMGKRLKEANASVLEGLFEATVAVWDLSSEGDRSGCAEGLCRLMIEKGITGRPKAAAASNAFLQLLVSSGKAALVGDSLVAAFSHKTPKNRQSAASSFATLVENNGLQGFGPTKALMKAIAPLCNDTNGQVRKEALNFIVQCQVHVGPSITTFLGEHLRDVQMQELEKLFQENVPVGRKPAGGGQVGGTKSSTFAEEGSEMPSTSAASNMRAHIFPAPTIDPSIFNELDEAAVIPALPKTFYKVTLDKAEKWQDRCRMVQEGLLPLLQPPRLRASDDYMDLVKCLRDLLNDPQIPINTAAFKAIQELSRGLREGLGGAYMRYLIPAVFEKFKDKKMSVLDNVYTTLGLFLSAGCCGFDSLQDEIDAALSSKIPHHRAAMVTWLNLIVPHIGEGVLKAKLCRSPHLRKLITDEKVEVRDGALNLIGRLTSVCGDVFADVLSALDSKQMAKVHQLDSADTGGVSLPPSPSKVTAGRRPSAVAERPSGKRPLGAKPPSASSAAESQVDVNDAVAFESSMPSKADALARIEASLRADAPPSLLSDLSSKEWKKRQDAVLAIQDHVTDDTWSVATCSTLLEPLVVVLATTPGFKESIFQVATGLIGLLTLVVQKADLISMRAAYGIISGLAPKLSDMKCRDPTKELLSVVAEGVGPKFVAKYLLEVSGKLKQPKQLSEALLWVEHSLEEFASCPVDAKSIINFVKVNCFSSQPPAIKTAGISLVAALRVRVGPKLEAFYEDINPHINTAIADEANSRSMRAEGSEVAPRQLKASCKPETQPSSSSQSSVRRASPALGGPRHADPTSLTTQRHVARSPVPVRHAPTSDSRRGSIASRIAPPPQPDLPPVEVDEGGDLPRTDIGVHLVALAKEITNGTDWKARLASVKKVDALCNRYHKHIAAAGVSDTLKALAARFQEPNKNFVVDVLRTMSLLVTCAPEEGVRNAVRATLPAVLGFLGDQKQPLREEAATFAHTGFLLLGLEAILPIVQKPITADAMFAQAAILDLLEAVFEQHILSLEQSAVPRVVPPRYIVPLIIPLLRLGMGRHVDVRVKAEQVLIYVINVVGGDAVVKGLMDLRPAEQQSVKAMVDRAIDASNPQQAHHAEEEQQRRTQDASHRVAHAESDEPQIIPYVQVAPPAVVAQMHQDPYSNRHHHHDHHHHDHSDPPVSLPPNHKPVVADLADILDGFRTSAPEEVLMLCGDFRAMFATDKTIGRADTIEACGERLRSALCNPRAATMSPASREMCSALIAVLSSIISTDVCAANLGEGLLREIYSLIVDALMTEPPTPIVRALNEFALATVVKGPVDAGFQALLGCLSDYTVEYLNDPTSIRHRYTTLIVKCIMRLESKRVTPEVLIDACYEYLVDHPPAVFKGKDDLSIRTIKMCIGNLFKIHKDDFLAIAERHLRGKTADGGVVLSYIRSFQSSASPQRAVAAPQQQAVPLAHQPTSAATSAPPQLPRQTSPARKPSNLGGNSTASHAEESSPVRSRSTANPAAAVSVYSTAEVDEVDEHQGMIEHMEEVFCRARKPETSQEGIKDMYRMLRGGEVQSDEILLAKFNSCFKVCSNAFQAYLARRMSKAYAEDPVKPTGFAFPQIVTDNLS